MSLAEVNEHPIDLFGRDHFGLAGLLLENGIVQWVVSVENGHLALNVLADGDADIVQGVSGAIGLDLVDHVFELEGEVFRNGAGLLPGKDLVEVLMSQDRTVSIQGGTRLEGKAGIEVGHELRQIEVALEPIGNAAQAHFLDQPVLQGLIDPFHPALRLGCVGAQDGDLQALHGPSELGEIVSRASFR